MREGLRRDLKTMLSAYYSDVDYWVQTMEADNINMITAGTPTFESYEDARAWRTRIKAILREFEDAI